MTDIQTILSDPNFKSKDRAVQLEILRQADPKFAAMPPEVQEQVLGEMSPVLPSQAATTGAAGRFIEGVGEEWPIQQLVQHPIDSLMGVGRMIKEGASSPDFLANPGQVIGSEILKGIVGPFGRGMEQIGEGNIAGGLGHITAGGLPLVTAAAAGVPGWLRARRLAAAKAPVSPLDLKGQLPETALRARESVRQQKLLGMEEIQQRADAAQAPIEAQIAINKQAKTDTQRGMARQLQQESELTSGKKMTLREARLELERVADIQKRQAAEQVIKQSADEVRKAAPEFGQAVDIIERSDTLRTTRLLNYAEAQKAVSKLYEPWDTATALPENSRIVVVKSAEQPGVGMGEGLFTGMDLGGGAGAGPKTVVINAPFYKWGAIKEALQPYYDMALKTAQGPTPSFRRIMETDDIIGLKEAESYLSDLKSAIRAQFPGDKAQQRGLNKLVMSKLFPEKGKPDLIRQAALELVNGKEAAEALDKGRAASKLLHEMHDGPIAHAVAKTIEGGEPVYPVVANPVRLRAYVGMYKEKGINIIRRQVFDEILQPAADPVTGALDQSSWAKRWAAIPAESKAMIFSDDQIALGDRLMQPNTSVDQLMQQYKDQVWGLKRQTLDVEKTNQQRVATINQLRTVEQLYEDQLKTLAEQMRASRGKVRLEKAALQRNAQDQLAKIRVDMSHERAMLNKQIAADQSTALKRKLMLGTVIGGLGAYGAGRVLRNLDNLRGIFSSP